MTGEGINENRECEAVKSNGVVQLKMDRNWELLKRKCRTKMHFWNLNDPLSNCLKRRAAKILFHGMAFMSIFPGFSFKRVSRKH